MAVLVGGMRVTRLYVNNSDDNENVMRLAYQLLSLKYKLVKVGCGDEVVDEGCVVNALFEMCISELEFITCSDFDTVVDDLYYVLGSVDYEVDMEFILEVEDGYVYLVPQDIRKIVDEEGHDGE